MIRIIFGFIVAFILIGISYFNARIYGYGLNLNKKNTKLLFFIFLLVTLMFAMSMVLGFDGALPSFLHRIIHTVTGFVLFLFFGALLLKLIYTIGFLLKIKIPKRISIIVLILSLSFSALGFIQARFIKVVDYTIQHKNLPENLIGKKAIMVSDTHFGLINQRHFSDKIVEKIISLNPDFVLHAGDFYDGPKIETAPITKSWEKLTTKFPVFMAPGNHEEYGDYEGFLDSLTNAGVTVLEDDKAQYENIEIVGLRYRENRGGNNAMNMLSVENTLKNLDIDDKKFTILINHAPEALKVAHDNKIDLQISGHTHNGQFWPMNYIVRSIYKEFTYGLNNYEDIQVITASGVGTASIPSRLFNTPELVRITFSK